MTKKNTNNKYTAKIPLCSSFLTFRKEQEKTLQQKRDNNNNNV